MTSKIIERHKDQNAIAELLNIFPVTAILGPRQVGMSDPGDRKYQLTEKIWVMPLTSL